MDESVYTSPRLTVDIACLNQEVTYIHASEYVPSLVVDAGLFDYNSEPLSILLEHFNIKA